jgi:hypothetical protein
VVTGIVVRMEGLKGCGRLKQSLWNERRLHLEKDVLVEHRRSSTCGTVAGGNPPLIRSQSSYDIGLTRDVRPRDLFDRLSLGQLREEFSRFSGKAVRAGDISVLLDRWRIG